jgi:hypothetical protein
MLARLTDPMILDGLDLATDQKISDYSPGIGACGKGRGQAEIR